MNKDNQSAITEDVEKQANIYTLPEPALLNLLFKQLALSPRRSSVKQALNSADDKSLDSAQALSLAMTGIVRQMKLPGVNVAVLRWMRFDHHKLPVLIWHHDQWWLLHTDPDGQLRLMDNKGNDSACGFDQIAGDAAVIYFRVQRRRTASSLFNKHSAARLVFSQMFKRRRWMFDVLVATVLVNILAIFTSLFAMQVYDRVVPTLAYATLWTLAAGMGGVLLIDWLLKSLRARILDSASCEVNNAVSQQVFDHLMQVRLDQRPRSLGAMAAQVNGLDSVRQFFSAGVVFGLVDFPFALFFIALISIIGGQIALVYLSLLPVALLIAFVCQKRLKRLTKEQMQRVNERQGALVEAIRGSESIKTLNASWRFSDQWHDITQTIGHYNIQHKAISSLSTVTTGSLASVAYVSALVVGVYQIEAGNLTMGALIACSILGGRVIAPIAQGVQHVVNWQNVSESLQMVDQLLALETERTSDQTLLIPDAAPEKIVVEQVHFSYPNSPIKQLDVSHLSLVSGDKVLLLGPIGSGKSTLLKVLAGLYKPTAGRVQLGDVDLWQLDPVSVAEHLAYLPQQVHLFKGTLQSNLALSGMVSDDALIEVAQDLGIDKIAVDSAKGFDLEISEGGEGLSGGQQQLVGLARVLLAKPKIWLLDEPTASLDNQSDQQVMSALKKHIAEDDIVVIASHRQSWATAFANRVIVMKDGQIVDDGQPNHVMTRLLGQRSNQRQDAAPLRGKQRVI